MLDASRPLQHPEHRGALRGARRVRLARCGPLPVARGGLARRGSRREPWPACASEAAPGALRVGRPGPTGLQTATAAALLGSAKARRAPPWWPLGLLPGLVHLDLKPENLMMFQGRLKLIDVDGCVRTSRGRGCCREHVRVSTGVLYAVTKLTDFTNTRHINVHCDPKHATKTALHVVRRNRRHYSLRSHTSSSLPYLLVPHLVDTRQGTANLCTKILACRGFGSSRILILRGGTLMSVGIPPEIPSQRILAGMTLVGRSGVGWCLGPRRWGHLSCSWKARGLARTLRGLCLCPLYTVMKSHFYTRHVHT